MSIHNTNIEYLSKSKNKSFGFSLIELSIVLIIIGLLVAGITGGASLIKSAELRAVMSEIRNYQTAVNSYYVATGMLPGTNGSSQMAIEDTGQAMADMANENILDAKLSCFTGEPGAYVCAKVTNITSGVNAPASKLKGSHLVMAYYNQVGKNLLLFLSGTEPIKNVHPNFSTVNAPASAKEAKILDEKLDDGISDSGSFFGFAKYSGCSTVECNYADVSNSKNCNLGVVIGL